MALLGESHFLSLACVRSPRAARVSKNEQLSLFAEPPGVPFLPVLVAFGAILGHTNSQLLSFAGFPKLSGGQPILPSLSALYVCSRNMNVIMLPSTDALENVCSHNMNVIMLDALENCMLS